MNAHGIDPTPPEHRPPDTSATRAAGASRESDRLREADGQARRAAQTLFDGPFVLEAGAGTGKTTALVSRIVGWTMNRGWEKGRARAAQHHESPGADEIAMAVLDGVVAITFTEAAAAEMETGVGRTLSAIVRGEIPPYIVGDNLPDDPSERSRRAEALLGNLDRLQAHTIHGWCSRLLNRFPLEAGLHPRLTVDADGSLRRQVAEEVVEEHLHAAYTHEVEAPLLRLARDGKGPGDLAEALILLVEKGVKSDDLVGRMDEEHLSRYHRRLTELFARIEPEITAALSGLSRAPNAVAFATWVERVRSALGEEAWSSPEELEAFLAEIADEDMARAKARLKDWRKGSFGKGEEKALDPAQQRTLSTLAPPLLAIVEGMGELRPIALMDACSVLQPLLAEVLRRLRERGVLGYEDLLRHTRELLQRRPAIRRLVRQQTDQLLVDEFQDTNELQCEIIALVARQGEEDQRPGLFLVGDPKQSIYGWRGADLSAYDRFVRGIEASGFPRWRLSVNFRSTPDILDEVRRIVEPVMRERAEVQPPFEPLLPSPENADGRGYRTELHRPIEHWISRTRLGRGKAKEADPLDPGSSLEATELESERLTADLLELQREGGDDFRWSDIALLFRAAGDLENYLARLRQAGIPYAVEHDRLYYQRREIIDAVALATCVLVPEDLLALLTFLRSPWVGVPNAALPGLWLRRFPHEMSRLRTIDPERLEHLHDMIDAVAAELPADAPGIERIEGWQENLHLAVEHVAALRSSFAEDDAATFVRKLQRWSLAEAREALRYLGPYRAANLQRFFRLLRENLDDPDRDPREVVRRLRRGIEENAEEQEGRLQMGSRDAVRVMTIHKAKGLDFQHVYLLQTHKESGRNQRERKDRRSEVVRGPEGLELRLLGYPTLGLAPAHARLEEASAYERVRLLYVALTRAKRRLVIVGGRELSAQDPASDAPEADPFDPVSAGSFSHLLAHRRGLSAGRPPLAQWAEQARRSAISSFLEELGEIGEARWRFLAVEEKSTAAALPQRNRPRTLDPEQALEDAATLAGRRAEAARRRGRPFGLSASAGSHQLLEERFGRQEAGTGQDATVPAEDDAGDAPRSPSHAGAATLAGTAVHAALEHYDPSAPEEMAWLEAVRRARAVLDRTLSRQRPETAEAARRRLEEILVEMEGGPIVQRLRELGPSLLGRELPLLRSPDGDGDELPVAFHSGSIDLLYRDPRSGEIVVADYKTDRVGGDELAARAEVYRRQGEVYCKAVRQALGLSRTPRFELWFVRAGRIVQLEVGA